MTTPDIIVALTPVIEAFNKLSIQYFIGGSVASSIYGMARATMDVDIVADIKEYHIPRLKQLLDEAYYIDEQMIKEAIRTSSSFNLIHFQTAFKIDIFIYKDEPHQRLALDRKVKDKFDEGDLEYYFSAPEDIILAKLQWYLKDNKVSERQWLDIIGVLKVQAENLDIDYLKSWSKKLNVYSLLEKAFFESGLDVH